MCRRCLILLFLLFLAPPAGATDEEWRTFERSYDYHPDEAIKEAAQELQRPELRRDKHAELRAIRKLSYRVDPSRQKQVDRGIALAQELRDVESLVWLYSSKSALMGAHIGHGDVVMHPHGSVSVDFGIDQREGPHTVVDGLLHRVVAIRDG